MLRYLIGFVVTVGLVILLVVLLFTGGTNTPSKKVPTTGKALDSYASSDAQVRLTIDGPINANEDHRQTQYIIDRDNAVINLVQGYDNMVIDTHSYSNTQSSYATFLHALELNGFTRGTTSDASLRSEIGHCADGYRYVFELVQNGMDIERFWTTSCGSVRTFEGNSQFIIDLFRSQIPSREDLAIPSGL